MKNCRVDDKTYHDQRLLHGTFRLTTMFTTRNMHFSYIPFYVGNHVNFEKNHFFNAHSDEKVVLVNYNINVQCNFFYELNIYF